MINPLKNKVRKIRTNVNKVDLNNDEWGAVAFPWTWFPGKFIEEDPETEELFVYFLKRSYSNKTWFVWPELSGRIEDKAWWMKVWFH